MTHIGGKMSLQFRNLISRFLLVLIFFLLFYVLFFITITNSLAQGKWQSTQVTPYLDSLATPTSEIKDYRYEELNTKVELISTYSDRIANIFLGTGAIIVTLIAVFLGINLFINSRQYKNDIENISRQVEVSIDEKVNENYSKLKSEFQLEFTNLSEKLKKDFDSNLRKIKGELISIQINQLEMQAHEWSRKGVTANEIDCYVDMIELNPEHPLIDYTLDNLIKALKKITVGLDVNNSQKINSSMEKLGNKYKPVAEQIIELAKCKLNPYDLENDKRPT